MAKAPATKKLLKKRPEKKRPKKGDLKGNQDYLKSWNEYQMTHKGPWPLLLPVSVDIDDGIIVRERIKSGEVAAIHQACRAAFNQHATDMKVCIPDYYTLADYDRVFNDYIDYFHDDAKQGLNPPGPLDFYIRRPVWFLFHLPRENWRFSDHKQFSMEHDCDDMTRNCEKVCTFDGNRYLLLSNRRRSAPPGLKYNLHVTISQTEDCTAMETDIIIDPGMHNDPTQP